MTITKYICVVGCCFSFCLGSVLLATSGSAEERQKVFIEQFEKLKHRKLRLNHPDHPFQPYLGKRIDNGLSETDKVTLLKAQESGNCFQVSQLVKKGFYGLYPFIDSAFTEPRDRGKIGFMIGLGYVTPFSRCLNLKSLRDFKKHHELSDFAPVNLKIEIEEKHQRLKRGGAETDRDKLVSILLGFGSDAFCDDYHLSMLDVFKMANKAGGMILTDDEVLFLAERARHHGSLEVDEYNLMIEKLRPKYASLERFEEIREASRRNTLQKIDIVRGFWQWACVKTEKFKY